LSDYDTLAGVYEFLTPEALLDPRGSADAFALVTDVLAPGARVLDCAAGIGSLAVGLELRGFDAVASDASPEMVARTRALAAAHGVEVPAVACSWEGLVEQGWAERFDAVFCVGNSLTHAAGSAGRRAALAAVAGVLAPGGRVAITSRDWERIRAAGSRLEVDDRLVERGGRRALLARAWTIAGDWDEPHALDVAVALIGAGGAVETHAERLTVWPFTPETLDADLRAAGLEPATTTFGDGADRYLVTARRG
jgi:SAM-dependent methyltransferase